MGGVSPLQLTRRSEERRKLLSGVRGGTPAGNASWRILKATKRSVLHLYADALEETRPTFFVRRVQLRRIAPG